MSAEVRLARHALSRHIATRSLNDGLPRQTARPSSFRRKPETRRLSDRVKTTACRREFILHRRRRHGEFLAGTL